jgi:hypothetical protein
MPNTLLHSTGMIRYIAYLFAIVAVETLGKENSIMLVCRRSILSLALLGLVTGFLAPQPTSNRRAATFLAAETTVEVCGFKDCKRAGGGPRLEKLINEVQNRERENAYYVCL